MRIQNTPFGSNPFKRSVAVLTAGLFVFTGLFNPTPAASAQSVNPIQVHGGNSSQGLSRLIRDEKIQIPPELGIIDESFHGESGRSVVYLQDAHDSLEAQENIAKTIHYLVSNYGVKTVFEEGYEGPVPTDKYFGFMKDPTIKEKVSYFLMDHLRIGGAEYAHINRTQGFALMGADSLKLHKENVGQYRLSASKREGIAKDLKALSKELKTLTDARFPKEFKEWLKTKEQFDGKKLDLFTYLGRTLPLLEGHGSEKGSGLMGLIFDAIRSGDAGFAEKVKHIDAREVFGELLKLEEGMAGTYLKGAGGRELFEYTKELSLLDRLNALQVSQEEYEAVRAGLEAFDTDSFARFIFRQAPKTLILSRMWERNIKEALRFYEIASARDGAVSTAFEKYFSGGTSQSPVAGKEGGPAVLVYGGFHKEKIKRILEEEGISYVVVSPRMTHPSLRHEGYYKQLMTEGRLSYELPANLRVATRAESRIEVWEGNTALARTELGIMAGVARDMPGADPRSLGLAVEQALKTFASQGPARSENRSESGGSEHLAAVNPVDQNASSAQLTEVPFWEENGAYQKAFARVKELLENIQSNTGTNNLYQDSMVKLVNWQTGIGENANPPKLGHRMNRPAQIIVGHIPAFYPKYRKALREVFVRWFQVGRLDTAEILRIAGQDVQDPRHSRWVSLVESINSQLQGDSVESLARQAGEYRRQVADWEAEGGASAYGSWQVEEKIRRKSAQGNRPGQSDTRIAGAEPEFPLYPSHDPAAAQDIGVDDVSSTRSEARETFAGILRKNFSTSSPLTFIDLDTGSGDFILAFKNFLESMGYQTDRAIGSEPFQSVINKAPPTVRGRIIHANAQFPEEFFSLGKNTFDIITINHIETAPGELARRAKELLKPSGLFLVTVEETDVMEGIDGRIIREIRGAGFDVRALRKPADYPKYDTPFRSPVLLVGTPKPPRSEMRAASEDEGSRAFQRVREVYERRLLRYPKLRLLNYLARKSGLPDSHAHAYLLIGVASLISIPVTDLLLQPAAVIFVLWKALGWSFLKKVVVGVLIIWIPSFARLFFITGPMWFFSKFRFETPLRVGWMVIYNFVPFLSPYAVAGQLVHILKEKNGGIGRVPFIELRHLNDRLSRLFEERRAGFSAEEQRGLTFWTPELALLILKFKEQKQKKWKSFFSNVLEAQPEGDHLRKIIDERLPTIFIGSDAAYEALRGRIRKIAGPNTSGKLPFFRLETVRYLANRGKGKNLTPLRPEDILVPLWNTSFRGEAQAKGKHSQKPTIGKGQDMSANVTERTSEDSAYEAQIADKGKPLFVDGPRKNPSGTREVPGGLTDTGEAKETMKRPARSEVRFGDEMERGDIVPMIRGLVNHWKSKKLTLSVHANPKAILADKINSVYVQKIIETLLSVAVTETKKGGVNVELAIGPMPAGPSDQLSNRVLLRVITTVNKERREEDEAKLSSLSSFLGPIDAIWEIVYEKDPFEDLRKIVTIGFQPAVTDSPKEQRSEVRETKETEMPQSNASASIPAGLSPAAARSQATIVDPWKILRLKQDVIIVVEEARIDALSPERFKELLEIAGLNRGPLHLVIPDALQGTYSSRVAELQRIATVHYGFPQLAASEKIPVIGFSDMEHDTLQAFQKRLGPKLAGRMKDSAFGLNQAGSFGVGILYALKDIPAEQLLPNQNGFRYDRNGWYASQILEILQSYTVSSISA